MLKERKINLDNISENIAILRLDISQHQLINDVSLNIHSENYLRDVFNFIYGLKLENGNFGNQNIACIDLIDKENKNLYQITSTRGVEKVKKTFKILEKEEYQDFKIFIFYILKKPRFNKETILNLKKEYQNVNLDNCFKDFDDLIRDINNLETNKLIRLNKKYFLEKTKEKYTDEMVLDLVIKDLVSKRKNYSINYSEDFESIKLEKKIWINNLSDSITRKIRGGLDYNYLFSCFQDENERLLEELRNFVVEDLYRNLLQNKIRMKNRDYSLKELKSKGIEELNRLFYQNYFDSNDIIKELCLSISNLLLVKDFNSMNIVWIIISSFFEICDIGVKDYDNAN